MRLSTVVFLSGVAALLVLSLHSAEKSGGALPKARVEAVFCLDTTGSMGGLIKGAQQKIWSIVNGIASGKPVPEIKIGLVAFRDRGDAYVTQVTNLSSDLDAVHKALFALSAGGGGDGPESVNQALDDAVNKLSWSPQDQKVYRVIFLVGDAPPHMDYADDTKYPELCKAAVLKNIVINTVRCGRDVAAERFWQDIAAKSEGQYTSIAQDGGVQVVSSPYDSKIAELSGKLAGTSVFYGSRRAVETAERARAGAVAAAKNAAEKKEVGALVVEADKSEAKAKMAVAASAPPAALADDDAAALGGRGDLVAAFAKGGTEVLKNLKAEELSEDLKKLSDDERKALLESKAKEREQIQKEMAELSQKRAGYIQDELKKTGSGDKGFDAVVLKMLKAQGPKHGGIEYEK